MRGVPGPAAAMTLLLVLLLAGCSAQLPDPASPEKPGHPWTDTTADLWVARQTSCGECGDATTESATFALTLLYRDGAVLHALLGEGGQRQLESYPADEGNRSGLTFAFPAEHEDYRDEITDAWKALNGAQPDLVRVHEVTALRIDPGEREDVLRVVEHAVDQTKDLEQGFPQDCAVGDACLDGAQVRYGAWGPPQEARAPRDATLGQDPDAAWRLLEEQVGLLHAWLEGQS